MGFEKNDDYVEVNERVVEFRTKYPNGALQPVNPNEPFKVMTVGDKTFIAYTAAAYRHEGDKLPGIACAWELFPGKTPYTKDSELQNAETAAWGRAIMAALAADARRGIASAVEVRNRKADQAAEAEALNALRGEVVAAFKASGMNADELIALFGQCGGEGKPTASADTEALTRLLQALSVNTTEAA
ncbi:hypothetical protein [Nocardia brasiliensis]|uniref:hypothetical protein n=1 Tax=Nocardia brasiliensis TaxID=37326 RepID=UPI0024574FC9|nr:hypothetical protein [Nocardia brasiliensis]